MSPKENIPFRYLRAWKVDLGKKEKQGPLLLHLVWPEKSGKAAAPVSVSWWNIWPHILVRRRKLRLRLQCFFLSFHLHQQRRKKIIIDLLRLAAHKEEDFGLYYPSGALCCAASSKKSTSSQTSHQHGFGSPGGTRKADGGGMNRMCLIWPVVDVTLPSCQQTKLNPHWIVWISQSEGTSSNVAGI